MGRRIKQSALSCDENFRINTLDYQLRCDYHDCSQASFFARGVDYTNGL